MNYSANNEGSWGVRMQRILAAAASVILASLTFLPGLAHAAAGDLIWSTTDQIIDLTTYDVTIVAGSTAESLVINNTNVVVTTGSTDTFTIRGNATTTRMFNNSGASGCVLNSNGYRQLVITGVQTVTITPDEVGCGTGGGGGGGGGGGITVITPACTITAPNGGQTLKGGAPTNITWTSAGSGINDVALYYSVDGGSIYGLIKTTANDGSEAWTMPNTATVNAKVKVVCRDTGGGTLASDASDSAFTISTAADLPAAPAPSASGATLLSRTDANVKLPASFPVDTLVKLPDDGNPNTYTDTTVYYIGLDAKRHPFPGLSVYNSWYADFSGVKTIDMATLSTMTLGNPVLVRPGTHWVKIQSDPKTYYVEPGYTLRWIKDEAAAKMLGGSDWNKNIIDIEPTYFTKFKVGADLDSASIAASWPSAALLKGVDGKTWYTSGSTRREVATAGLSANKWQSRFVETSSEAGWQALAAGTAVTAFEDGLFSQLVP